jgi:transcriptional regulator with GAF, ATPase, and Fis domain
VLRLASTPFVFSKLARGQATWFGRAHDLSSLDGQAFARHGIRSAVVTPLPMASGTNDAYGLAFASTTAEHEWTPATIELLKIVSAVISQSLARKAGHETLERTLVELGRLRDRATEQEAPRRTSAAASPGLRHIVSDSPAVRSALAQLEQVAPTSATVLLFGETGAGKEVFAQAIHDLSPRRQRQMIRVSCAAIPAALIESELFGRERGAYTGAITRQVGRFEAAEKSTIFLDEIGELSADVQVKLLRVIQERVVERLGSSQSVKVDVRIVAATNRNLEKAVEDKSFREDLFYRLNVFPINVPPLRERLEDIPGLAWAFVGEFSKSFGKPIDSISKASMGDLQTYSWPGNVRELRNVIERAVILSTDRHLTIPLPRSGSGRQLPASASLADLEIEHIRATLEATNWRIRGNGGAAERLGLKPTTLESRMAKLGLVRPAR